MTRERNQSEAFTMRVDIDKNKVIIEVNRGITGPLANQLRIIDTSKKGASIIKKMGIMLSQVGDILYSDKDKAIELINKYKIKSDTGDDQNETN